MGKTDRLARLYQVDLLLYQNPRGLTLEKIAYDCEVSTRTTRRDLVALESAGVPIYQDKGKWLVETGHYLPPIHISLPEAMTIFLAARLMLGYAQRYDRNMETTFQKLNSIVPSPLKEQIRKTMEWMQKLPKDEDYLRILGTLSEAWAKQHTVKVQYHTLGDKKPTERSVDPYFIEPAAADRSSYVIAYCHRTKEIRTFKIERINSIEMTSDSYVIPPDFDANAYLASAWGIEVGGEATTIKLRFAPDIARIMEETKYHTSQKVKHQADGSVIITIRVAISMELCSWILRWGEKVEVLEPEELRKEIKRTVRAMKKMYG